ncbi:MFS transporter [Arthrobacter woluwensis]|uniref:MFS transporter n=1 Tax=Arthrobacter woluwensis TaxID=156980 RepID=UPI001AAF4984|nr:MFS transporter [Arthrobacter woluwensis]QTF71351.1 MFS transporter [Arthrobacter woluwensis]
MTTAPTASAVTTLHPAAVPIWRYLGLVLAPGVGSYAFNAVTVSLSQLHTEFSASDAGLELVVAGYGIPFATLLILGGRLGDRYGRHRMFTLGMVVFLAAALACSFAPNLGVLIAARIAQGLGAALCTPQVLATIQATSDGAARVRAISAFGASGGIGAALGQVAGGALASVTFGPLSGWRAVYWLAAAIAAAAVVLGRFAPRSTAHEAVDIDVAGTLQLGGGVLLLAAGLTFGPSLGWPWPVPVALVVGAVLLLALWRHQNRIEKSGRVPLLPPSILRLTALQTGLLAAGLFFAGYGAILYVIPRALEHGLGLTPLDAGLLLLPFALVFTAVSLSLSRIQRWLGDRTLFWGVTLQGAALVLIAATVLLAWTPALPLLLQPSLVLLGAGQAMIFSPLTQAVVREIPVEAAGLSGGLFGTVQQLALSLGVILIGGICTAAGLTGQAEFAAGTFLDLGIALIVVLLALRLNRGRTAHE